MLLLGVLAAQAEGAVAAAGTYDLLETEILTGSQASVTFSSLGSYSAYQHFQIRSVSKTTTDDSAVHIQFNADTGLNYYWHMLYTADGSSVGSYALGSVTSLRATYSSPNSSTDNFSAFVCDILDPFSTNKNTTIRSFGGYATPRLGLFSGLWNNTNALTEIKIIPITGSLAAGSRFSLYGLRSA
jgi:hypothetical protein